MPALAGHVEKAEIYLVDFIPRPLASIAHVDAVEQEGKRGGVEAKLAVFDIGCLGPGESPSFQSFCQNPEAASIPVEDFEQGAAFVGESEDGAALGILQEPGGYQIMKTVEATAHVASFHCDEYFQAAGKAQHGRDGWSSRSKAAASWACAGELIVIFAPPGNVTSNTERPVASAPCCNSAGTKEKNAGPGKPGGFGEAGFFRFWSHEAKV